MAKVRVPQLETERLILRRWEKKDAPQLYEYAKNPNVGPPAGWKPHESVRESRMIIDQLFRINATWAVVLKESGRIVGSISLEPDKFRTNIRTRELGYSLAEDCWGRGLMTEAARTVIRYAFEEMKLETLMIRTSSSNRRSQRVIEKCGFVYEGTLRRASRLFDGTVRDTRVYSMLREEYEERRAAELAEAAAAVSEATAAAVAKATAEAAE
ncbi:MAG: GNAT family N-acetyltransferase [Firmicutes bacterium]|nr:GNAT family N-acetyltransferase [Bacillota bacterium]